jgi:hypothetical protein
MVFMVICFDKFHAKKAEKIARLRVPALSLREGPAPLSEAGNPAQSARIIELIKSVT